MSTEVPHGGKLKAALEAVAHARDHKGEEPVDLGEIQLFVRRRLPAEELEWLQARIVADPDAARLAAAMATFEQARNDDVQADAPQPSRNPPELSPRELKEDWERLTAGAGGPRPIPARKTRPRNGQSRMRSPSHRNRHCRHDVACGCPPPAGSSRSGFYPWFGGGSVLRNDLHGPIFLWRRFGKMRPDGARLPPTSSNQRLPTVS